MALKPALLRCPSVLPAALVCLAGSTVVPMKSVKPAQHRMMQPPKPPPLPCPLVILPDPPPLEVLFHT